jgi:hypothetical protein
MRPVPLIFLSACIIWLSGCKNPAGQSNLNTEDKPISDSLLSMAMNSGKMLAESSRKALGAKLSNAIRLNGIPKSIAFCSLEAIPTLDSLQTAHNARIRRLSHRARNPVDLAKGTDGQQFRYFDSILHAGSTPVPEVRLQSDALIFYSPIILNDAMCLHCHGIPGKDIAAETMEILERLYPSDNATGHSIGDLRGIWKIEFLEN